MTRNDSFVGTLLRAEFVLNESLRFGQFGDGLPRRFASGVAFGLGVVRSTDSPALLPADPPENRSLGMDANEASEWLDDLPFSSSIAIKVFHEALREYIAALEHNELSKTAFESRRRQAILTAEFRDGQISNDEGERLGLSLHSATFSEKERLEAGLSNGVGIHHWSHPNNPSSLVSGWISPDLAQYQTSFREALPLPEENRFTDCSRTDNEWLVIFWAMFELNPENRRKSPFPPSSNRRLEDVTDLQESATNIQQRRPIRRLLDRLDSVGAGDLIRFKVGRNAVVAALLKRCLWLVIQQIGRGIHVLDLVEFDDDSAKHQKPDGLTGLQLPYWPKTNSLEAIRQWVGCTVQALKQWQASLQPPAKWDDVISAGLAQQAYQDAVCLARHVRVPHGNTNVRPGAKDESLTAVLEFLDELEQAVSAALLETSPGGRTDDSAFVAANTLGEPQTPLADRSEKAYQSYKWAEQALLNRGAAKVTDRAAWAFLTEQGFEGYKPGAFDTWQRYVRDARKFHDDRKNEPRGGREGGSMVRAGETDAPMRST